MSYDPAWQFRDCPWCGLRDAQMNHLAGLTAHRQAQEARFWQALGCPRCGGVILIETTSPQMAPEIRSILPAPDSTMQIAHVPPDVAGFYAGAIRVLDAGVPDAAAVQLRRTLEAAAAHFGVDKGPLVGRIKKLIEAGLITAEFGKVLDHIREVGNVGAHASDELVDEETARRALRFTSAVLRNLFEIPAELAALGPRDGGAEAKPEADV